MTSFSISIVQSMDVGIRGAPGLNRIFQRWPRNRFAHTTIKVHEHMKSPTPQHHDKISVVLAKFFYSFWGQSFPANPSLFFGNNFDLKSQ